MSKFEKTNLVVTALSLFPPPTLCDLLEICLYSLLLRRECCSFSNGEYVKAGLAELEQWCHDATEEVTQLKSHVLFIPFTV